jgi:hypothetical protein
VATLIKHLGLSHHDFKPKDLLRYLAIAIVCLLGIAGILQNLTSSPTKSSSQNQQPSGYGTSVYNR